jgi:hypothetical protein
MRRTVERVGWGSFERTVTALLIICAALLGFCAALMWSYPRAIITATPTSSAVTKYQTETEAALSGVKEQQALTKAKLDAIRDELRALNEKAARAGSVAPPSEGTR